MFKKETVDLGYPFGVVEVPEGWELVEMDACCSSSDHHSHPYCDPLWGERVAKGGGIVVAGPTLDPVSGWKAVVAFPPEGVEDELVEAIKASRSLPATDWEDDELQDAAFAALGDALRAAQLDGLEGLREKARGAYHYLRLMEAILKIASSRDDENLFKFLEAVYEIYVTDHKSGVRG